MVAFQFVKRLLYHMDVVPEMLNCSEGIVKSVNLLNVTASNAHTLLHVYHKSINIVFFCTQKGWCVITQLLSSYLSKASCLSRNQETKCLTVCHERLGFGSTVLLITCYSIGLSEYDRKGLKPFVSDVDDIWCLWLSVSLYSHWSELRCCWNSAK